MVYVVLDNLDEGLEIDEVKDFYALTEYLREHKEQEGHYKRIQQIIFGEEVPWDEVKKYYKL